MKSKTMKNMMVVGLHHTEMKAVALGLISLPDGMPVRVIRSARMCGY